MNINQVKANILNGFARPNLFRVKIAKINASHQADFRINCYQAQIPGSNLATTNKDTGFRSAAYHRLYSDIILGFYCSENMQELNFFQSWIDQIVDPVTNRKGYYGTDTDGTGGYTSTVTIEHLSRLSTKYKKISKQKLTTNSPHLGKSAIKRREEELYEKDGLSYDVENEVSSRWILKEAYPKQVDPIQLDYGTNDTVMSMNVTLTYRTFDADFNPFQWSENEGISDFDKELGRKNWQWVDPQTGAYTPNPKTGTWSNARQNF